MTRRLGLASMIGGLLLTSMLLADPSVVKTTDGTTYRGDVTQREAEVSVTVRGVETVIPRTDIISIEPVPDYEKDFQARLAKLDQRDTAARITMAREAFEQRRYDLARDTMETAVALDPGSKPAQEMLDLVLSQIRMERTKLQPSTAPTSRLASLLPSAMDRRVLTNADIEAIRREELQTTDQSVRIRFVGDVKRRFADSQNMSLAEFTALLPAEQAIQIFRQGDATMRDKVHVLTDPQSMIEFRRQIQPLLVQTCGTIGCHGGSAGGGFMLLTAGENDAITYTNFYIMMNYSRKVPGGEGVFSNSERRLVERGKGEQSVLANYGLPGNVADYEHPPVNGKTLPAVFRNRLDARYRTLIDWMDQTLSPTQPNYGIRFSLPAPSTRPAATQPARSNP